MLPLAPLQLPLDGIPHQIGAVFALFQDGIHAVKRALRETGRHLLVVDLLSAHTHRIDDITNYYKSYFCRYLLLRSPNLLISSIHQQRSRK